MPRSLYDTAKLGPNQTRVLVVEPSKQIKDPIQCRLEVTTLSQGFSSIDFDALSYVWGDLTNKRDIQINGTIISITTSLERQFGICEIGRKPGDSGQTLFASIKMTFPNGTSKSN
jgi:hypothetical protein